MRRGSLDLSSPNFVQTILVLVLAVWTVAVFYLLRQASSFAEISLVSWSSLTAFFTGFGSIVLIVIAVILADVGRRLR